MRDPPLDYETLRRARDEDNMRHPEWWRVNDEIGRVVVRMLGSRSPDWQDVRQCAFVQVFWGLDGFQPRHERAFDAWVHQIARNEALNHCRKSKLYASVFAHDHQGAAELVAYEGLWDVTRMDRRDEAEKDDALFAAAYDSLRPELRFVLELRYWGGKSVQETAHILGVPEGTVKSRHSRAAQKIRDHIDAASRMATNAATRTGT